MRLPLGDQSASVPPMPKTWHWAAVRPVTRCGAVPSGFMVQMPLHLVPGRVKAMRRPSGDHAGSEPASMRLYGPASGPTYTAVSVISFSSEAGALVKPVNATCLPSGAQAGLSALTLGGGANPL